jgi:uncharacterized membrane protein YphA (DoxX/SURF4 family)
MNAFLWILQVVVALLSVAGGAYKVFGFDQVANQPWFGALSRGGWSALGVFELVCGVLLIVPAATRWMPVLTPLAAAAFAVESLALAGLYGRHSVKLAAENPLVWVVAGALLAAFVAYGRYALRPLA